MSTTLSLAPTLAVARLRAPGGGRWPDLLAVGAFTVCTWLAMTVAGGTWMFVARADGLTDEDPMMAYVWLAILACGLLVVPILSLGGAAARLGASSRAKRLASLRLVGATGSNVVAMSVVEGVVQAAIGLTVGVVVWAVSLPAWTLVTFQGKNIRLGEMIPPFWVTLAVLGSVLLLAALSVVLGLGRVVISPFGVAARQTPKGLRFIRMVVLVGALIAFGVFAVQFDLLGNGTAGFLIVGAFMGVVIGFINLVGPWILQVIALILTRTGNVARLIAFRRVLDDPKTTWRSIGSLSLLSLVAGYVSLTPFDATADNPGTAMLLTDVRTGVIITLGIGLALAASSTMITQAASVFDRREQLVHLERLGMPPTDFDKARRWEVVAPLLVTSVGSALVGVMLALPMVMGLSLRPSLTGLVLIAGTLVAGVGLSIAAAELCRPLTRVALGSVGRRAD